MKTTLQLVSTPTLICMVAGLLLAWVYASTLEPIRRADENRRREAIARVLPATVPAPVETYLPDPAQPGVTNCLYVSYDDDHRWVAAAVEATAPGGYGGPVRLMAGIVRDPQGDLRLHDIAVFPHQETPGLGAKITRPEENFRRALTGRPLDGRAWTLRADGGDIDGITAATISSRAVLDALKAAFAQLALLPGVPSSAETTP